MWTWIRNWFRTPPLPTPHPACVVGYKRYYQIQPWKRAK